MGRAARPRRFKRIDINHDLADLAALLKAARPTHVVNFAAQSMVGESWLNPDHWMMTNVVSTVRLHELLRNYDGLRVTQRDKAEVAELAVKFDNDYWDGGRDTGYGGYKYDGRWRKVADAMVAAYGIKPGMRILDVGSGKGFLLHDFIESVPGVEVVGIDVSKYAVEHTMETVKPFCRVGSAEKLPWPDKHFDLVVSINTLHNLYNYDLWSAFREIERVSRGGKYICVEAYRNEREKVNLMYWQLTCRAFLTPQEWAFVFKETGYTGDHELIYFE